MKRSQAQQVCDEWAAILGLSGWKISVKVTKKMPVANAAGFVMAFANVKQATIYLYSGKLPFDSCMEETIVHELLHVWLWQFVDPETLDDLNDVLLEQNLNSLSEGLVALRRSAKAG